VEAGWGGRNRVDEPITISLRNLPEEVEKAILEISRRERLRKPVWNCDFEEFSGTWPSAEADEFDAALGGMRQVDPTDWKPAG
jgi:hypothetical protein